jgi:hypothetical protein
VGVGFPQPSSLPIFRKWLRESSNAAELGTNTGAITHCGDRFADSDDDGRYKMLYLKC